MNDEARKTTTNIHHKGTKNDKVSYSYYKQTLCVLAPMRPCVMPFVVLFLAVIVHF